MVFIRENNVTRIALPMKHLAAAGDWGSDIGTASLYVNGERAFPKNTNTNDSTLIGMFHEEFWKASGPITMLNLSGLPQLYCSSVPGGLPNDYHMAAWGFGTSGKSTEPYFKITTGVNVCSPHTTCSPATQSLDYQLRYTYNNTSYAQWNHYGPNMPNTNCYYSMMLPTASGVHTVTSTYKCAYNFLLFNRTDQNYYFLARPYALLLFKDWTDTAIGQYFGSSGYNDGTTTLKFGFNFLTAATWSTPLDWPDIYMGVYKYDFTVNHLNNRGWLATYHVVDKYTYDGHTYHIVTAGVADKTIPASVSNPSDYKGDCPPYGLISTPVFNVPYSQNRIDWEGSAAIQYGYPIKVYVLEFGAEYYLGVRQ